MVNLCGFFPGCSRVYDDDDGQGSRAESRVLYGSERNSPWGGDALRCGRDTHLNRLCVVWFLFLAVVLITLVPCLMALELSTGEAKSDIYFCFVLCGSHKLLHHC